MIAKTLKDIAVLVDGTVVGENVTITGLNGIKEAVSGDLSFLADPKYLPFLSETKASALVVSENLDIGNLPAIRVKNPVEAFSKIVDHFLRIAHYVERGIHPTAVIGDEVHLGQNVSIGPNAVIQKGCRIGDDVIIGAGCFVGFHTRIGDDCEIYPNVTIRERIKIGHRVIVHSGTVIGADGFGYQNVNGKHVKIPQAGIVRVEDDVEIGANVTIDRARLHETVIGAGTKIDNLVQIGHNSIIGKNCLILAQVGVSGSVVIGDNVIFAGQSGIVGHVTVGNNAQIAAKSAVMRSVGEGEKVMGSPARNHIQHKRIDFCLADLPEAIRTIRRLSQRIEQLENELKKLNT